MAIITVSRGSYSFGKIISERVAQVLGYKCISREVLVETASKHHVREKDLFKALHDSPSFFENKKNREKYLNMIKATLIKHAMEDNIIYHGNAGHFLLPNISCLLKVRLVAGLNERIELVMKLKNLNENEAKKEIENEDRQRSQWTKILYNQDLNSPFLYDIIIHIQKIDIDKACDIICNIVKDERFNMTDMCKKKLIDEYILTKAKIELFDENIEDMSIQDRILKIKIKLPKIRKTNPVSPSLEKDINKSIMDDTTLSIYKRLRNIPYLKDIMFEV